MNPRPLGPEPSALPTALHPVIFFIFYFRFFSLPITNGSAQGASALVLKHSWALATNSPLDYLLNASPQLRYTPLFSLSFIFVSSRYLLLNNSAKTKISSAEFVQQMILYILYLKKARFYTTFFVKNILNSIQSAFYGGFLYRFCNPFANSLIKGRGNNIFRRKFFLRH